MPHKSLPKPVPLPPGLFRQTIMAIKHLVMKEPKETDELSMYRRIMLFIHKRGIRPPGMPMVRKIRLRSYEQDFDNLKPQVEVLSGNTNVYSIEGVEIKSFSEKAARKKYYKQLKKQIHR